mmetsp:Transcript_215/g.619  ORF Transcript_215/g.619 Transcript_215/m.619 type:complete len:266 (+) Transcript_215:102-899(+)|eukprot:CAMPEP_0198655146 /NCGR_PEP_ID=MMETSP1467-20131203/8171_1 /TAXON_ID=1462469 /ORGANISM="unid. sp., Strain CCMP2135" /LENGTH=265 /DNA_ID=CAMNT_0044391145 /DNA_START=29 /DNA_END=826 /DNA_ORIENTATION=+
MMSTSGFSGSELEAFGGGRVVNPQQQAYTQQTYTQQTNTPTNGFFERLSTETSNRTYEAAELQDCRQHLWMCAERIAELESINVDLETRLETQANDYVRLEAEAADSQRRWKDQYEALERECDTWRQSNSQLELKNHQLRNQLLRTERELHGILQKKYEFMELARKEEREKVLAERADDRPPASTQLYDAAVLGGFDPGSSKRANGPPSDKDRAKERGAASSQRAVGLSRHQNPHSATPEEVRLGRVILALSDFFGMSNNPRGGW